MKPVLSSIVCAIVLLSVSAAGRAAAPQNSATTPGTNATANDIGRSIHDDSTLSGQDVKVSVSEGVATLTGTVATSEQKNRAGVLANVKGITRVVNQIVVNSATVAARTTTGAVGKAADKTKEGAGKAADKTKEGVGKAADKTKEGVAVAADKTKEGVKTGTEKSKEGVAVAADKTSQGVRKAGSGLADALVLASVKTRMAGDAGLKGSDINVDSADHVITLRGTVPTEAARARALELAGRAEGVDRVVDRLTIGPKK
jgi:hyperosmotically inducible protein